MAEHTWICKECGLRGEGKKVPKDHICAIAELQRRFLRTLGSTHGTVGLDVSGSIRLAYGRGVQAGKEDASG